MGPSNNHERAIVRIVDELEDKVSVTDPVSKFIPEFKNIKVGVLQTPGGRGANAPAPKLYTAGANRRTQIPAALRAAIPIRWRMR
jgi:hypothetical protein